MHPSLTAWIERFRHAQDRGVAFVVEVLGPTLGARLPTTADEWVTICAGVERSCRSRCRRCQVVRVRVRMTGLHDGKLSGDALARKDFCRPA
ncbi:MAG TPA: hypothetical protein VD866_16835 [Urbifossiella sp.]|nr:hypothetical protein [Urbifossiella sp.]